MASRSSDSRASWLRRRQCLRICKATFRAGRRRRLSRVRWRSCRAEEHRDGRRADWERRVAREIRRRWRGWRCPGRGWSGESAAAGCALCRSRRATAAATIVAAVPPPEGIVFAGRENGKVAGLLHGSEGEVVVVVLAGDDASVDLIGAGEPGSSEPSGLKARVSGWSGASILMTALVPSAITV